MQIRNPRSGVFDYQLEVDSPGKIKADAQRLRAYQQTWLNLGVEGRIEKILRLHGALEKNMDELLDALSIDTGRKRISEMEIAGTMGLIQGRCYSVQQYYNQEGDRPSVTNPTVRIVQQRVPYPVVGVISPWNFPLLLALIDTIPALLAGCTVLLKPSEVTPRFIDILERCVDEVSDFPGALSIVRGGADAGKAVVDQADVICFTGSVETGKKIAARCAERFIPSFLELGGKDPAIVLADADIEITSDAIIRSCAGATGQACQSLERIYAHEDIYEALISKLVDKVQAIKDNSDYKEGGVMGPLIFDRQAAKIKEQIDDAEAKGAEVLSGGEIHNIDGGLWLLPTVVVKVDHSMSIMTDETFGPVIPVMQFSTIDEAIALANDSQFGLSASVFGKDIDLAKAVASRIEAGGISINDASLTNQVFDAEKNSFKNSGLYGSRMGAEGFLRFFRKKALLIQEGRAADIHIQAEETNG